MLCMYVCMYVYMYVWLFYPFPATNIIILSPYVDSRYICMYIQSIYIYVCLADPHSRYVFCLLSREDAGRKHQQH